jgi:hypothetical protein
VVPWPLCAADSTRFMQNSTEHVHRSTT